MNQVYQPSEDELRKWQEVESERERLEEMRMKFAIVNRRRHSNILERFILTGLDQFEQLVYRVMSWAMDKLKK